MNTPLIHLPKKIEAMRIGGVCAVFLACACSSAGTATVVPAAFDGQSAMGFVGQQMAFGPRVPGSGASVQAADWIISKLDEFGWASTAETFDYRGVQLRNILGSRGSGDAPLVLLGAHYDSRKVADQDPGAHGEPVPGANDGASGVGLVLELARVLPTNPPACRVQLAFFDGEDSGGLDGWDWIVGSTYMADHLSEKPDAFILVDMVGDEDLDIYFEGNSDPGLRKGIWDTANALGYKSFVPIVKYTMVDDHIPFLQQGIRSVDIIDFDYPYWHTRLDTLDKLSSASLEQVGRTLQAWLSGCPGTLKD
jgi:glutaminyl-peptide cyclotransferase